MTPCGSGVPAVHCGARGGNGFDELRLGTALPIASMVISPNLPDGRFGYAMVIPCKSKDVVKEAEWLWTAERDCDTQNKRTSADRGCVALVENSENDFHHVVRNA